jgi:hypothetical protein
MQETTLLPYVSRSEDGTTDWPMFRTVDNASAFAVANNIQGCIIGQIVEANKLLDLVAGSEWIGVTHFCLNETESDLSRFASRLSRDTFLRALRFQSDAEKKSGQN